MREMHVETVDGHVLRFGHGIPCAPQMTIERRPLDARVESRLASVLEDLAAGDGRTVGQLLEVIVLHSFEKMESKDGCDCSPAAYRSGTFRKIAELKQRHGANFDVHANYGFTEKGAE
ncbi:MAG TPA: hypothetical protein VNC50_05840, partial [Planctomycetia bacterium]|nr:hypothetical protein [Planctomycetia bacterium]